MLRFPQSNTPAIQDYLNAQYAMFTSFTEQALQSMHKVNELNVQTAVSVMEDSMKGVQQVLVSRDPYEAASITASQAQPCAERLREYQQQLGAIAANTQLAWNRVAEAEVPNASQAARAVADEIAKGVKEQTEQAVARQKQGADKAAQAGAGSAAAKPQSSVIQAS